MTVMLRSLDAEPSAESVTPIENGYAPKAVGVPEIVMELLVLEDNDKPGGRSPVSVQANGAVPPSALITPI